MEDFGVLTKVEMESRYEVEMEQVGTLATGFNRGGWWGRMTGDEQMT